MPFSYWAAGGSKVEANTSFDYRAFEATPFKKAQPPVLTDVLLSLLHLKRCPFPIGPQGGAKSKQTAVFTDELLWLLPLRRCENRF